MNCVKYQWNHADAEEAVRFSLLLYVSSTISELHCWQRALNESKGKLSNAVRIDPAWMSACQNNSLWQPVNWLLLCHIFCHVLLLLFYFLYKECLTREQYSGCLSFKCLCYSGQYRWILDSIPLTQKKHCRRFLLVTLGRRGNCLKGKEYFFPKIFVL